MGIIYIIINKVNNKVYIGQTTQTFKKRISAHNSALHRGSNTKLYKAIREYGVCNFEAKIIEKCDDKDLNDREKYYIDKYDSFKNGYNSNRGGSGLGFQGVCKDVPEIIELYKSGMSSMQIAKKIGCSDETILNVLKSEEIPIRSQVKEVIIIDTDLVFESCSDAARYLISEGVTRSSSVYDVARNISKACRNMSIAYGLKFAYRDDVINNRYQFSEPKQIVLKRCKMCGCPLARENKSELCGRCQELNNEGVKCKPSKDELEHLLDSGLNRKQIARMYDRSVSTVTYWMFDYGLR